MGGRGRARRVAAKGLAQTGGFTREQLSFGQIMNARLRHFNLISDYAQDNPGSEPRIRNGIKLKPAVCSYIAKYSA